MFFFFFFGDVNTFSYYVLRISVCARFYQMDKTSLQDHVGKIRAALCDKGSVSSF
jgi:CRISPR/Cas system-associated protein endoribonuclease Cas2